MDIVPSSVALRKDCPELCFFAILEKIKFQERLQLRLADRGRMKYLLLLYIECIMSWYRLIRHVHDGLGLKASLGFTENPFSEAVGLHPVYTEYVFFSRPRLTRSPVHSNKTVHGFNVVGASSARLL